MKPILDDIFETDETTGRAEPRAPSHHDLAEYRERPKRRAHPMVVATFVFLMSGAAFYGAEKFAPVEWKPSHTLGGYEQAMAEARKEGELTAQLRYAEKFKQVEVVAQQWGEQYKAAATGVINNYQAAYQRAGIFAQATADIQKQYQATRYQVAAGSVNGELQVANMATMLGALGGLFNPDWETGAQSYADTMRNRALAKLDEAARGGITISVDGWNTGLPDPGSVARSLRDLPPLRLPRFEEAAVTPPVVVIKQ